MFLSDVFTIYICFIMGFHFVIKCIIGDKVSIGGFKICCFDVTGLIRCQMNLVKGEITFASKQI